MKANTGCLSARLRELPRLYCTFSRSNRGFCSLSPFRASQRLRPQLQPHPRQRQTTIPALQMSTGPSASDPNNPNRSYAQLLLILATSAAVGTYIYWSRDSVQLDGGKSRKTAATDPTPAPTSGMPVPPNESPTESAEKPYPVMAGGSTSTQRSISFVPAGHEHTTHQIHTTSDGDSLGQSDLPVEEAILTTAPHVPPRLTRNYPVLLKVPLITTTKMAQLTSLYKYEQWTFNGSVPGPFIRARVGDVVELSLTNKDTTGNPHNIDCHAFTGPGGGAALTTAEENETKTGRFRLLYPGLFLYHCAAAPVPVHIANGMYGLMYVQPEEDSLPPVDREYYVMQSEFYHEPPEVEDDGRPSSVVEFSYPNALREEPNVVVFNGHESALTRDSPLKAQTGETIRVYFGNAGPNMTSALHLIGSNFMRVYRDGGVLSPPSQFIQTVGLPPGDAMIADMKMVVPGTYTLVDHAMFRLDKGAVGYLNVSGKPRPDIYQSAEPPAPCVGCKLHP